MQRRMLKRPNQAERPTTWRRCTHSVPRFLAGHQHKRKVVWYYNSGRIRCKATAKEGVRVCTRTHTHMAEMAPSVSPHDGMHENRKQHALASSQHAHSMPRHRGSTHMHNIYSSLTCTICLTISLRLSSNWNSRGQTRRGSGHTGTLEHEPLAGVVTIKK